MVWGGGVVCVPSPPALVVIGVGGPIVLVGGVIVGFAAGATPGVGAGDVGVVACAGAVVCGGGAAVAGGGAAARRCAAAQVAQLRIAMSRAVRFVIRISSRHSRRETTGTCFLKSQTDVRDRLSSEYRSV